MCLLGIAFGLSPEFPVMLLANREELYARPSAAPQIVSRTGEAPAWIGGVDLLAGGTWLGVAESGLVVAVTNRAKTALPLNPRSRGILCRSLLEYRDAGSAGEAAQRELESNQYAGCNLLIADRERAFVIEAGNFLKTTTLSAGLHLIANHNLNPADDPRIGRVRRAFDHVNPADDDNWFREARRVCQLTAEGNEPAIWLHAPERGTVSSTVLGIGKDFHQSQYRHAPSPHAGTRYDDYSPLFQQLLSGSAPQGIRLPFNGGRTAFDSGPASSELASPEFAGQPPPAIEPPDDSPARHVVRQNLTGRVVAPDSASAASAMASRMSGDGESTYRFFLRGPWQIQPLARVESYESGTLIWSGRALPAAGTFRLPASWQALFGEFRGRVRFKRRFHPPSNLELHDRLFIVCDGITGEGVIGLNGRFLGRTAAQSGNTILEVTGQLRSNNVLEIDLQFVDFSAELSPRGLFGPVALEIRSPSRPARAD